MALGGGVLFPLVLFLVFFTEEEKALVFSYKDAVLLGVVQGITEFLPISSTGHLILLNELLGLNEDPQMRYAMNSYSVVIQGGSIFAIVFLYWQRIKVLFKGLFSRHEEGRLLMRNILLAFLPAALLGPFLDKWIEAYLFDPMVVAAALCVGAFFMFGLEYWRKKNANCNVLSARKEMHHLSPKESLFIGGMQCLAMCPGMSRSMMTVGGGYLMGFSPVLAAEFSFLLGFVTLGAASCYKLLKDAAELSHTLTWGPSLLGYAVAFFASIFSIRLLVYCLTRYGLVGFAIYRILLAFVIFYV